MEKKNAIIGSTLAIAAIGLLVTLLVSGALLTTKTITSSGTIAAPAGNLGIYSDSALTQTLTSISWGTVSPGSYITKTFYVKNLGATQVTLSMTKANWNPTTANGPVTVTWDREGTVLATNQVSYITLTLSASSSISGITNFSVDIIISGTG